MTNTNKRFTIVAMARGTTKVLRVKAKGERGAWTNARRVLTIEARETAERLADKRGGFAEDYMRTRNWKMVAALPGWRAAA
jgi:hypothetical protein